MLDNAISDLGELRERLERRLTQLARREGQAERFAAQADQLQADIEAKEADLNDLEAKRAEAERIIREKDAFLQEYESSFEDLKKIEALDSAIEQLDENRKVLKDALARELASVSDDVLAVAVEPARESVERQAAAAADAASTGHLQTMIRDSTERKECSLCSQPLSEEVLAALQSRLDGASTPPDAADNQALALRALRTAGITPNGSIGRVIDLETKLADNAATRVAKKQEVEALRDALHREVPEDQVARSQQDRDRAQQDLGRLKADVERIDLDVTGMRATLEGVRDRIKQLGGTGEVQGLRRQSDLAGSLRSLFESGHGHYRDRLREDVESEATEIFRALRSKEEFDSLKINENYGLEILNERGDVVTGRSAGEEQVVALSLIGALNRNAMRRAPVMMDTPFGRLDPTHKEHVLRFLSQLAEQVFLLVHGGEVSEEDLGPIAAEINSHFDLHRSGPDRTEIRVRRAA